MTTLDLITLLVFGFVVLLGLAGLVLADMARQRPEYKIRERLRNIATRGRTPAHAKILADLHRAQAEARRRRRREAMGSLGYYLNRLDTVSGPGGSRRLAMGMGLLSGLGVLLLLFGVFPMHVWTALLSMIGVPLLLGVVAYRWLVGRFRNRFLAQLPDAMDMLVRASRAGIPVTQTIREVGLLFEAPLGPEFNKMGGSLLLGNDLQNVLDDAVLRVELSDFSFFAVCLSLQRESGGSVVEALENLSGIIRARRDLGLRARALTAEGRLSGLILALLPFIIMGLIYVTNQAYVEVLFFTESGQQLLWVAGTMLCIGVLAIRQITRMEI